MPPDSDGHDERRWRGFALLLLILAAFQLASALWLYRRHPFLSLADAILAVLIVAGVIYAW